MPSLLPGFENDVFISYRHNDNLDGWVTEFVQALERELKTIIKEPLTIYFDKNPHDGLLETHHVDKSLEGKLKSLVFIPILSQTYCDPKSYAWNNEFCPFHAAAQTDPMGRDIRLSNGNTGSRLLPVKIHDLDADDIAIIERELGAPLRSVEFIYKEPGVNRPLKASDRKTDNHNKTDYGNQVNKLANAIKEILKGIQRPQDQPLTVAALAAARVEKSIVVLPFVNMSVDPEQEYFSDGLTEDITTELSRLHDLLVISRSSAMTFKNSNKKIWEIARELNVSYVLEGSVRKSGNQLRITAQLIDAEKDGHLWAEKYDGTRDDVFDIQEKVSRAIVNELKVKLNARENNHLAARSMKSAEAYDYYLRARRELIQWNEPSFEKALKFLNEALVLEGPCALIYGAMAYVFWSYSNIGIDVDRNTRLTEEYVARTFAIDSTSPDAHLALALLNFAFRGRVPDGLRSLRKVIEVRPNDFDALMWSSVGYYMLGKPGLALPYHEKMNRVDPTSVVGICLPALAAFYQGNFRDALEPTARANSLEPTNFFYIIFEIVVLGCLGEFQRARKFALEHIKEDSKDQMNKFYQLCVHVIDQNKAGIERTLTPEFVAYSKRDPQWSHFIAQVFSFAGYKEETFEWIDNAVNQSFCNYPLLSGNDPIHTLLAGDPRFEALLVRMKGMWEGFE